MVAVVVLRFGTRSAPGTAEIIVSDHINAMDCLMLFAEFRLSHLLVVAFGQGDGLLEDPEAAACADFEVNSLFTHDFVCSSCRFLDLFSIFSEQNKL